MDLQELREQIDAVDRDLVGLFERRMQLVEQVADYKLAHGMAVLQTSREQEVIKRVTALGKPQNAAEIALLYCTLMDISKQRQSAKMSRDTPLSRLLNQAQALPDTPQAPVRAACAGVRGSYSEQACRQIFDQPEITYCPSFEEVFKAVNNGCTYGVLPIENSTAGSVDAVYDLLAKYQMYIVRSTKMKVEHYLLAPPGAALDRITQVYSHQQAIDQCSSFFQENPQILAHPYSNTATAAEFVSALNHQDVGAIASKMCAEIYGLDILKENIQNVGGNYTRFICISKQPYAVPNADKISVRFKLSHQTGSLYKLLMRFALLSLNLVKIESRPIADTDFEVMFYCDFEGSIKSKEVVGLLSILQEELTGFAFMGNFEEI